MRWSTVKHGDTRTVRRFAWIPVDIVVDGKCVTVWLERYTSTERLHICPYSGLPTWHYSPPDGWPKP